MLFRSMKKKKTLNGDIHILTQGACGCDIPFDQIHCITDAVKGYYHQSAPDFWMWKMFQFGYAYGKREERARRKRHER